MRRIKIISSTKIKYLSVAHKIYQVTSINWQYFTLEAKETDLSVGDVPECELFPIEDFAEFKISLSNDSGMGEIIDFGEWINRNKP